MKVVTTNDWYFDSGCSRHMTGEKSYLNEYQNMPDGHVSFSDGRKGCVLGKGTLLANGLPKCVTYGRIKSKFIKHKSTV